MLTTHNVPYALQHIRNIFNQIIVDHISVIRILTAHLLVHLTLTMLIGALKERGE